MDSPTNRDWLDLVEEAAKIEAGDDEDASQALNVSARIYRLTDESLTELSPRQLAERYWDHRSVVRVRRGGEMIDVDDGQQHWTRLGDITTYARRRILADTDYDILSHPDSPIICLKGYDHLFNQYAASRGIALVVATGYALLSGWGVPVRRALVLLFAVALAIR